MTINGNYSISRNAYEKAYTLTLTGAVHQRGKNTLTLGAVFTPDLRKRHDKHLVQHGVENISKELFNTVHSIDISPLDSENDGAWGSMVRVEGDIVLTEHEYEQLVEYEEQYDTTLKAYHASRAEFQELSAELEFDNAYDTDHHLFEIEDMMMAYKYQLNTTRHIG